MSQVSENAQPVRFHVQVGLAECLVRSRDEVGAVEAARNHFVERMPELSEIIRGIADKEFRVDRLG
ncbi:MAG: hypothetical protein GXX96_34510 [Planctomycetaceae bacterium]|nr:hypothetical protein [Planctomycetaceae bacterium]